MSTATSIRVLYALIFLFVGGYANFFPLWLEDAGWNNTLIGWLTGAKYACIVIFPMLWGGFADRLGSRVKTLRVIALLSAVAFVPTVFTSEFWPVLAAVTVFAACRIGIIPVTDSLTLSHIETNGGDYGRFRLYGSAGFVVGGFLVAAVVGAAGRHTVPLALLCLLVLTIAVILRMPIDERRQQSHRSSIRTILTAHPALIRVLIVAFLWRFCGQGLYSFLSIHLGDLGVNDVWVPAFWAVGVLAEIIMFQYAEQLFGHIPPFKMLLICLAACVVQYGLMAIITTSYWLYPVMTLHGFTFGMAYYTLVRWLNANVAEDIKTSVQGLFQSVSFGIGGATSAIICGYLFEMGRGPLMYATAAVAALVTLGLSWWLLSQAEHNTNPVSAEPLEQHD